MRPPCRTNLVIYKGADFRHAWVWPVLDVDGHIRLVDLTGCSGRMHIRARAQDPSPLLVLSTDNGRMALGAGQASVALHITHQDTEALNFSRGVYDVEITFANNEVIRFAEGRVRTAQEITRELPPTLP